MDAFTGWIFGLLVGFITGALLTVTINNGDACAQQFGRHTQEYALCRFHESFGEKP